MGSKLYFEIFNIKPLKRKQKYSTRIKALEIVWDSIKNISN